MLLSSHEGVENQCNVQCGRKRQGEDAVSGRREGEKERERCERERENRETRNSKSGVGQS